MGTTQALGIDRWKMLRTGTSNEVSVVGIAGGNEKGRVAVAYDAPTRKVTLSVGASRFSLTRDGVQSNFASEADDDFLLASVADHIAAIATRKYEAAQATATLTKLSTRTTGVDLIAGETSLLDCQQLEGAASFSSAARTVLSCTSAYADGVRVTRGEEYVAALSTNGEFSTDPGACASQAQTAYGRVTDAEADPPNTCGVQLLITGETLVAGPGGNNAFCRVAASASGVAAGGGAYYVCTGTAAVAGAAGGTLVAPGVGTVAGGGGAAAAAQPWCIAGGVAVGATVAWLTNTALNALPQCRNATAPEVETVNEAGTSDVSRARNERVCFGARCVSQSRYSQVFRSGEAEAENATFRTLGNSARQDKYRAGGCVFATVTSELSTRHVGGAPFSSQFDIYSATLSASLRAYSRCSKEAVTFDAESRGAALDFSPTQELPNVADPGFWADTSVKLLVLGNEVRKFCGAPAYSLSAFRGQDQV